MRAVLTAACLVLSAALPCFAHDLGVEGTIYEIEEPDIRAVIFRQLYAVDFAPTEDRLRKQTRDYGKNLDDYPLPHRDTTRTYYITPQVTTRRAIYAPELGDDGRLQWTEMVKAGTTANALDTIRPVTAYFVFNADDPDEVSLMKSLWRAAPNYITPLASAGNPIDLGDEMKVPVYRASPFILKQFDLEYGPALVRVGEGKHHNQLAITEFAPPFTLQRALQHISLKKLFTGGVTDAQP